MMPPPEPAPSGQRARQVAARRAALLDAAVRVIARKGLTGVTMRDIAAEAGCSYGVVAFHFQSKHGVLLAALDHLVALYDARMHDDGRARDTPAARVHAMIALDFDPAVAGRDHVAALSAFWAEAARDEAVRRRCAELRAGYDAALAADIAALAAKRGVQVDAAGTARALNALIDGLWIASLHTPGQISEARVEAQNICRMVLRGVFPKDF